MSPLITLHTAAVQMVLMAILTLIGRQIVAPLPFRLRARAKLYLAPALGLALLVFVASTIGRFIGFATIPWAATTITAIAGLWALWREPNKTQALAHAFLVAVISFVAGSAVLICLLRYGGYNCYSDAFTYLYIGNWLQHHGFLQYIPASQVEPYTTQPYLYQVSDFRMGAIYALGWVQAAAQLEWSYLALPITMALATNALSFAALFVASILCRVGRIKGYLLACLPALGLGAIDSTVQLSLLPQDFGLALALSFLAFCGVSMAQLTRPYPAPAKMLWAMGIILGGQFAAVAMSYSEMSPFVGLAAAIAVALGFAFNSKARHDIGRLVIISAVASAVFLNWEAWRVIKAVLIQSGVTVGGPVDLSVIDFAGFAFWLRNAGGGGAGWLFGNAALGYAALAGLLALIVWTCRRTAWVHRVALLPLACFAGLMLVGFVYFRYFVASPFPIGVGQSWSQFKLANWIALATAVPILAAFAVAASWFRRGAMIGSLTIAIGFGLAGLYRDAPNRIAAVLADVGSGQPIFTTLLQLRSDVKQTLRPQDAVFLQTGQRIGLRELLTYILDDVNVESDWRKNDHIWGWLPESERHEKPSDSQYVIGFAADVAPPVRRKELWRVGPLIMLTQEDAARYVNVKAVAGADSRESNSESWWYWVKKRIEFTFDDDNAAESASRSVSFEYSSVGGSRLTLNVIGRHNSFQVELPNAPAHRGIFEKIFSPSFGPIQQIVLTGSGEPTRLSEGDPRIVRFQVTNLQVQVLGMSGATR